MQTKSQLKEIERNQFLRNYFSEVWNLIILDYFEKTHGSGFLFRTFTNKLLKIKS